MFSVNYSTCILNVPIGSRIAYWLNWSEFYNVNEMDFSSGIGSVAVNEDVMETGRYSINGTRIDTPQKGINVIKYSDGSTKKVLVK